MKKLILFDFDGTLADTSEGIINSHVYAHQHMDKHVPAKEVLYSVIGGPLLNSYISKFCFSETDAKEAVRIYREYYAKQGINEACLYKGMSDLLKNLHNNGFLLGIATLKAEKFAISMTENLCIREYFSVIHGIDGDDKKTKAQIIEQCISDLSLSANDTIMIGDSIHDYNGAKEAGVDFIGVSYGFGFNDSSDINPLCSDTESLYKVIIEMQ